MGTNLRVLSESYPMNTNMTGVEKFSKIFAPLCFGRKVALEGLRVPFKNETMYSLFRNDTCIRTGTPSQYPTLTH